MSKQKTLKSSFSLEGKGLHTGLNIKVTFNPAPENFGFKIRRIDIADAPLIDAVAENVNATERGTVISKNGIQISTIEHGMAALYAYEIDNCLIEVNAPEFPILEGSSIKYVEKIEEVGIEEQNEEKNYFVIQKKIEFTDENTGSTYVLLPDNDFCINTLISFNSPILSNQFATLERMSDFKKEIAASRTFVFVREIQMLLQHNLIKGGDLDNAIVIYDQKIKQEEFDQLADTMGLPHKEINELGYINNRPLVFDNEPARHKLLDLIGDLSLIGRPIKGRIIATKPGHASNNRLARIIRREIKKQNVQAPSYNPNQTPLMDINEIRRRLPHAYPFLLVDKVIEKGENYVIGVKNITINEPFFSGHFPEYPIMPGVLQIEGMAQTSALLARDLIPNLPEDALFVFSKIENVRFRKPVFPGDTILYRVELNAPPKASFCSLKGYAFVGETMVSEAEFIAQVSRK